MRSTHPASSLGVMEDAGPATRSERDALAAEAERRSGSRFWVDPDDRVFEAEASVIRERGTTRGARVLLASCAGIELERDVSDVEAVSSGAAVRHWCRMDRSRSFALIPYLLKNSCMLLEFEKSL